MEFVIKLFEDSERQLKQLAARNQRTVLDGIDGQLRFQPDQPTKNRKRLRENPLAEWELRVGQFRGFYDIVEESAIVAVIAIGVKKGNKVYIEGKEHSL